MTVGARFIDPASGAVRFDTSTETVKFFGTLSIGTSFTGAQASGSITDSRFSAYSNHTPYFARIDTGFTTDGYDAFISIDGNTLSWSYPNTSTSNYNGVYTYRPNQTIIYGVY